VFQDLLQGCCNIVTRNTRLNKECCVTAAFFFMLCGVVAMLWGTMTVPCGTVREAYAQRISVGVLGDSHLGWHLLFASVWQGCYKGVTRVLRGCNKGVARML
jgi:hypothetical protein